MSTFVLDGRYIQDHFPGIGRYAFNLAEALARVAPDESFRIIHDPRLVNTRYDLDLLARRPNVELMRVAAPTFSLREQWLGARRALTRDAALWHSAYYVMPYLLPLSVVVTLGDVMPLVRPSEMPGAARRLVYRVLNALAARAARTVITFSRAARDGLERALGIPAGKIVVVPLAADARFGAASTREIASVRDRLDLPEAYALYLGANKPHKNLGRLIRAWARVGPVTDSVLVVAGHWDARYPEARIEVAALGLERRVLFRADVADADVPALISGARVFVFPSLYEGFGLPPLEAMACGTPVVAADAPGLAEVAGGAALLFDPLDVGALGDALACALADAGLRASLREQGLARARQFSWERTARETLCVYRACR